LKIILAFSLDEKIRKLDEQLIQHRQAIQKLRPGAAQDAAKRRALAVLKQKRLYEGQREQLYNQQANLDTASFTMEGMQSTVQAVQALQASGKELKTMMKKQKELQVDNIWKTLDQMDDLRADFEEIQDALGSYNAPVDIDDDELMEELDALGDEVMAEGATTDGLPAYLQDLPEAPTGQAAAGLPAVPAAPVAEDEFGLPAVPQRL